MYPTPPVELSSGEEWQFEISTIIANISRSSGRSILPPPVESSSGHEWQFEISIRANISRSTSRSTPMTPSGEECQFEISNIRANIGRSTSRSIPLPPVESFSGQEWQY